MVEVKEQAYKVSENAYFVTDFKSSTLVNQTPAPVLYYGWSAVANTPRPAEEEVLPPQEKGR